MKNQVLAIVLAMSVCTNHLNVTRVSVETERGTSNIHIEQNNRDTKKEGNMQQKERVPEEDSPNTLRQTEEVITENLPQAILENTTAEENNDSVEDGEKEDNLEDITSDTTENTKKDEVTEGTVDSVKEEDGGSNDIVGSTTENTEKNEKPEKPEETKEDLLKENRPKEEPNNTESTKDTLLNLPESETNPKLEWEEYPEENSIMLMATNASGTWKQDATGWWFEYTSGGFPKSKWEYINNKYYFFNTKGYMVTGWFQWTYGTGYNNKWYYLDTSGARKENYWLDEKGSVYYFDANGIMVTDWQKINSIWYYFNASGTKIMAKIGNTDYKSLEEAMKNADSTGKTIKICQSLVNCTTQYGAGTGYYSFTIQPHETLLSKGVKEVRIKSNLEDGSVGNGKVNTGDCPPMFYFSSYTDVTFSGYKDASGNMIKLVLDGNLGPSRSKTSCSNILILNNADATIEDGVEVTGSPKDGIFAEASATVTVNGGTIYSNGIDTYKSSGIYSSGNVIINGGEFYGMNTGVWANDGMTGDKKLTITGGYFHGNDIGIRCSNTMGLDINVPENKTLDISYNKRYGIYTLGTFARAARVDIKGVPVFTSKTVQNGDVQETLEHVTDSNISIYQNSCQGETKVNDSIEEDGIRLNYAYGEIKGIAVSSQVGNGINIINSKVDVINTFTQDNGLVVKYIEKDNLTGPYSGIAINTTDDAGNEAIHITNCNIDGNLRGVTTDTRGGVYIENSTLSNNYVCAVNAASKDEKTYVVDSIIYGNVSNNDGSIPDKEKIPTGLSSCGIYISTGISIQNCNIFANEYGIHSIGKIADLSGTKIQNNLKNGILNQSTHPLTLSTPCEISGNGYRGIYNLSKSALVGGKPGDTPTLILASHEVSIHDNPKGITNSGILRITDANIHNNIEDGIYNTPVVDSGITPECTIEGGTYAGNGTTAGGAGIKNDVDAQMIILSADVTGNHNGVVNSGSLLVTGGNYGANTYGALLKGTKNEIQNGVFYENITADVRTENDATITGGSYGRTATSRSGIGVQIASGTTKLSNAYIYGHNLGVDVASSATLTITGALKLGYQENGSIKQNTTGLQNSGTVNHTGGAVSVNSITGLSLKSGSNYRLSNYASLPLSDCTTGMNIAGTFTDTSSTGVQITKAKSYGLYVTSTGTVVSSGSKGIVVTDTGGSYGIYNMGTLTINKLSLVNSSTSRYSGIYNTSSGKATLVNATIDRWTNGIYNNGTATINGNSTVKNTTYSVYQNGTFKLKNTFGAVNPVYLKANRFITVIGDLGSSKFNIKMDNADITNERVMAKYTYQKSADTSRYALESTTKTTADSRYLEIKDTAGDAAYPYQVYIKAEEMEVTYHANYKDAGDKTYGEVAKSLAPYTVVSNERTTNFAEQRPATYVGWDVNPNAYATKVIFPKDKMPMQIERANLLLNMGRNASFLSTFALDPMDEANLYAIYDYAPSIERNIIPTYYEGETITKDMLLKGLYLWDGEDKDQGKPLSAKILQIKYGGIIRKTYAENMSDTDTFQFTFEELKKTKADGNQVVEVYYSVTDSVGNTTKAWLPVHIRWNEFPEIQSSEQYYLLNEIMDGSVNEAIILETASAIDVEDDQAKADGIIIEGKPVDVNKTLKFTNFDIEALKKRGSTTVTLYAVDRWGKETLQDMVVHIIDGDYEALPDTEGKVRFISEDFYLKPQSEGGLHENSLWRTVEEYRQVLENAFKNKKDASGNWKEEKVTISFTAEEIQEVKQYIKDYKIGNSKEEWALKNFYIQFADNFVE